MNFPSKSVVIGNRTYDISGVSAEDPYFSSVGDDLDPEFRHFCTRFLREDYVCLDIGANIGLKSLLLSQFVPVGRVAAVEAAPTVCDVLESNIRNSHTRNIVVSRCAVSETDGDVSFVDNSAYGHISRSGTNTVPSRRISTILAEHGLAQVDFIKIDVEGYEFSILKEALTTINEHKALVVFEFNAWCQLALSNVNPVDFAHWILASFSHVYFLQRGSGDLLKRVPQDGALSIVHRNLVEDGCVTDIVATNASEKLSPSIAHLQKQLDDAVSERDTNAAHAAHLQRQLDDATAKMIADLAQVVSERDVARAEVNAMRSSTSWRISAPIRALRQMMRKIPG